MRLLAGRTVESIAVYQAGGNLPGNELIKRFGEMIWPDNPTPATILDAVYIFQMESIEDLKQMMDTLKSAIDSLGDGSALDSESYEQIMTVAKSYRRYATLQRS